MTRHHSQSFKKKQKNCQSELVSNSQLIQTRRLFLSALILALTSSPALLSSLTVLGEEEEEEAYGHLHTLISEPVKPEWRVHAAAAEHFCNHSSHLQCFFFSPPSRSTPRAHTTLKGNDATLFAVFKPFIFVVFFFFYLNHLKIKAEN